MSNSMSDCSWTSITFSFTGTPESTRPEVAAKDAEDEEPRNMKSHADVGNSGHCKEIRDR